MRQRHLLPSAQTTPQARGGAHFSLMKSTHTLINTIALLLMALMPVGAAAQSTYTWDFGNSDDITNLKAELNNSSSIWSDLNGNNHTGTLIYYATTLSANTFKTASDLKANGQELNCLKGQDDKPSLALGASSSGQVAGTYANGFLFETGSKILNFRTGGRNAIKIPKEYLTVNGTITVALTAYGFNIQSGNIEQQSYTAGSSQVFTVKGTAADVVLVANTNGTKLKTITVAPPSEKKTLVAAFSADYLTKTVEGGAFDSPAISVTSPSGFTNYTVTYSISSTAIATIDASAGQVTPVAKGNATVTAHLTVADAVASEFESSTKDITYSLSIGNKSEWDFSSWDFTTITVGTLGIGTNYSDFKKNEYWSYKSGGRVWAGTSTESISKNTEFQYLNLLGKDMTKGLRFWDVNNGRSGNNNLCVVPGVGLWWNSGTSGRFSMPTIANNTYKITYNSQAANKTVGFSDITNAKEGKSSGLTKAITTAYDGTQSGTAQFTATSTSSTFSLKEGNTIIQKIEELVLQSPSFTLLGGAATGQIDQQQEGGYSLNSYLTFVGNNSVLTGKQESMASTDDYTVSYEISNTTAFSLTNGVLKVVTAGQTATLKVTVTLTDTGKQKYCFADDATTWTQDYTVTGITNDTETANYSTWDFTTLKAEHFANSWWKEYNGNYGNANTIAQYEKVTPPNPGGTTLFNGLTIQANHQNWDANRFNAYPGVGISINTSNKRYVMAIPVTSGKLYRFSYATSNTDEKKDGNDIYIGIQELVGGTVVEGSGSLNVKANTFTTTNTELKSVTIKATADSLKFGIKHTRTRLAKIEEIAFEPEGPSFSPESGTFGSLDGLKVTMTSTFDGVTIRYKKTTTEEKPTFDESWETGTEYIANESDYNTPFYIHAVITKGGEVSDVATGGPYTYTNNTPTVSYSAESVTVDITALNAANMVADGVLPTLTTTNVEGNEALTVEYTSSNETIAKFAGSDLHIRKPGAVTITARVRKGENVLKSASYTLTVTGTDQTEGTYDSGTNTLTFDKQGVLTTHEFDITNLNIAFAEKESTSNANRDNTAVVNADGLRLIDDNGFSFRRMSDQTIPVPLQGSFYVLKPGADGMLYLKGTLEADGDGTGTKLICINEEKEVENVTIDVENGILTADLTHKDSKNNNNQYYLYNAGYTPLQLKSISYQTRPAAPVITDAKSADVTNSDNIPYYNKDITVTATPAEGTKLWYKWATGVADEAAIRDNPTEQDAAANVTMTGLYEQRTLTAYSVKTVGDMQILSEPAHVTFVMQKDDYFTFDYEEEGNQSGAWSVYGDNTHVKYEEVSGRSYPTTETNSYGKYTNLKSGSRSAAYDLSGLSWAGINACFVEFDLMMGVSTSNNSDHEFVLLGEQPSVSTATKYDGKDKLFGLNGTSKSDNWEYTDNGETKTVTLTSGSWYHFNFTISEDQKLSFTITDNSGEEKASGTNTFTTKNWQLKGLRMLLNRDNTSYFGFDNLVIKRVAPAIATPVINTKAQAYVEDANLNVNITAERGNIAWKITATEEAPTYTADDSSWKKTSSTDVDVDAKNFGTFYMHAIAISDDGDDVSYVVTEGPYTFTPSIAKPIIKIGEDVQTDHTVSKTFDATNSALDISLLRAEAKKDETVIWYRWGEAAYTKADMTLANTISTTTAADVTTKYVGFEGSEVLTVVAARLYGNGEYYCSDPVTLTVTSAEPAEAERLILMDQDYDGTDGHVPAVWTTQSAKFTRNIYGGKYPDYYGEYINGDTEGGQRMLGLELYAAHSGEPRVYWVEFDAQFDLSKAAANHTPELTLVGEQIGESNSLYGGSAALFRMASTGSTNLWDINQTGRIMPLTNATWYSYKFVIDETTGTVGYRIVDRETKKVVVQGEHYATMGNESYRLAQSLRLFLPNGGCKFLFDNLKVWTTKTDDTGAFLQFASATATADLTAMNFEEPKLQYAFPSNNAEAVIRFTTNNPNVGRVDYYADGSGNKSGDTFVNRMNSTGDLLLKNTGTIVVTATMYASSAADAEPVKADGNAITASYTVTVKAKTASYVTGNDGDWHTYAFDGDGQLTERQNVTAVPGVTVDFGPSQNANINQAEGESNEDYEARMKALNGTIVKYSKYQATSDDGKKTTEYEAYYATTLAQDGWRDVVVKDTTINGETHIIPTEGTFYKFTPQTSGKLRFSGLRDGGSKNGKNSVVMISYKLNTTDGTYSDYQLHSDVTINEDGIQTKELDLEKGRVYYLYGNNRNTEGKTGGYMSLLGKSEASTDEGAAYQWTTFQLTGYAYEVKFKFANHSYTLAADETSKGQTPQGVKDGETIEYTINCVGGITAELEGHEVKNISGGGAVIVTATNTDGYSIHYAITKPYTSHKWDFDLISEQQAGSSNDAIGYLTQYGAQWATAYKNDRHWYYRNDAVLTNRDDVDGENALYIPLSAGLVIKSNGGHMGTTVDNPVMSEYATFSDLTLLLKDGVTGEAAANYEEIKNYRYIVAENNGKFNTLGLSAASPIQFVTWRGHLFTADATRLAAMGNPSSEIIAKWALDPVSGEYEKMVQNVVSAMNAYNLSTSTLKNPDLLTIRQKSNSEKENTKITIPQVKKGQYVRIHMNRYTGGNGSKFDFTNLEAIDGTDLANFEITGHQMTSNSYNAYEKARGAYVFRVKADGDASFAVNNGWVNIYDIELFKGTSYKSEMIASEAFAISARTNYGLADTLTSENSDRLLYDDNNNVTGRGTYITHRSDFSKVNVSATNPIEIPLTVGGEASLTPRTALTKVKFEASEGVTFTLKENNGNSVATYDAATGIYTTPSAVAQSFKISVTACPAAGGYIKMTQMALDASSTIVVDRAEHWFSVASLTPQAYPVTWDFTKRNLGNAAANSVFAQRSTDSSKYGAWQDDQMQVSYKVKDVNGADIYKPAFASGGELSSGGQSFAEGKGLGVGVSAFDADNNNGVSLTYQKAAAADGSDGDGDEAETSPTANDGALRFNVDGSLTIPGLTTAHYVYIQTESESLDDITADNADPVTEGDLAPKEKVKAFKVKEDGTMTINIPAGIDVKRVGVTDITKQLNPLGYASESRDRAIDHLLAGEFTVNDVNAYAVTEFSNYTLEGIKLDWDDTTTTDDETIPAVKKENVEVVPANTGVIMYLKDKEVSVPMFVPAVNVVKSTNDEDVLDRNMMRPNVTEKPYYKTTENEDGSEPSDDLGGKYSRLILSRSPMTYYRRFKGDGTTVWWLTDAEEQGAEGFYRMAPTNGSADTMAANKAYLRIKKSELPMDIWDPDYKPDQASARDLFVYFADDLGLGTDADATGIDELPTATGRQTAGPLNVYSLSGQKIGRYESFDDLRLADGIYIVNGRKVAVKRSK